MKLNNYKHALVIGAENLSKSLDWEDRGTCVLFGDGAGAAILSKSGDLGLMSSFCKSEGSKYKCITIEGNDVDSPFVENKTTRHSKLKMDGGEVFKFATSVIVSSINKILKENNLDINDIDYIIPHQANLRIIDDAAKKLNISKDKFYVNLESYGNTSAASVPIAFSEVVEKNLIKKGDKVILVAFGGGLTWAGILLEW